MTSKNATKVFWTASILENNHKLKKLEKDYGINTYPKFDNYDALEVPRYDAIPSDYDGVMGVPITFLKLHNPNAINTIPASKFLFKPTIPI